MLRPYQNEIIDSVFRDLSEYDRVIACAATGSGKTVVASEIIKKTLPERTLFLADAQELVRQTADKLAEFTGIIPGVEMANSHASTSDKVVVATTQSIANRLGKYPKDFFKLVIVDECHRNSLGDQAQKVLTYFNAQVIGLTATPFRSDRKKLSDFYQKISCDVDLFRLIDDGFLSPIKIKTVPCNVDLSKVRSRCGDYTEGDLGEAIAPHIYRLAELLKEHASDRKTVVFLPLIETSKAFCDACNTLGLNAVHVDGKDRSALRQDWRVICNASLLTTGWDEPSVDCVYMIRPTKSFTLYSQCIGRGTRIAQGKKDLLVLDPLYQSMDHGLCRPARLIAKSEDEEKSLQSKIDDSEGFLDIQEEIQKVRKERICNLNDQLNKNSNKQSRLVDAFELAMSLDDCEIIDYQPTMKWEGEPPSGKQLETLSKFKVDISKIEYKGQACKILDIVFNRRERGLASPAQLKWLKKFGHTNPNRVTFADASIFLDKIFNKK